MRYAIERLLYRLSTSTYADRFLLKGAMLFVIWKETIHRPTRDLDLLGYGSDDLGELENIFREICSSKVEPDGLVFLPDTVHAETIRDQAAYGGTRVTMQARLIKTRIYVQVDIGFGDVVTPGPEETSFPVLLDFPAPQLRAYPIYTVVAEKIGYGFDRDGKYSNERFLRHMVHEPDVRLRRSSSYYCDPQHL